MLWDPSSHLYQDFNVQLPTGCSQMLTGCSRDTKAACSWETWTPLVVNIGSRTPWQPFPNVITKQESPGSFHSIFLSSLLHWHASQSDSSPSLLQLLLVCSLTSISSSQILTFPLPSASQRTWTNAHTLLSLNTRLCSLFLPELPPAMSYHISSTYSNPTHLVDPVPITPPPWSLPCLPVTWTIDLSLSSQIHTFLQASYCLLSQECWAYYLAPLAPLIYEGEE